MVPAALLLTVLCGAEPAPQKIDLGGLHQASAEIDAADGRCRIKLRMRAVTAFDAPNNAEMNRVLGRSLALQALARQRLGRKTGELSVRGARVVRTGTTGRFFELVLEVPADGIKVVEGERPATDETTEVVESSLFTRKTEYLRTIAALERSLGRELEPDRKLAPDQRRKVAGHFDRLASQVRNDLELSTIGSELENEPSERDQVLAALEQARQRVQRRLKTLEGKRR